MFGQKIFYQTAKNVPSEKIFAFTLQGDGVPDNVKEKNTDINRDWLISVDITCALKTGIYAYFHSLGTQGQSIQLSIRLTGFAQRTAFVIIFCTLGSL